MIKKETIYTEYVCDACGRILNKNMGPSSQEQSRPAMSVHFGLLESHFGYGSDNMDCSGSRVKRSVYLCEKCFTVAMHSLRLPVSEWDPEICPFCREPRNGRLDHPECNRQFDLYDNRQQKEAEILSGLRKIRGEA